MGVMDGFSPGASFEEHGGGGGLGMRRRRGKSMSSAAGDSVPSGSVRTGSVSRGRSESRSWSRSRSLSVEIIENPYTRSNPSNHPSPPNADAHANARAAPPDEVCELQARIVATSRNILDHECRDTESIRRSCNVVGRMNAWISGLASRTCE